MDKGDSIKSVAKFRHTLKDLPERYLTFTETEKLAIQYADQLFLAELARLQVEKDYKGGG